MHGNHLIIHGVHVWDELAKHKRSLTLHLSSHGWASRCPLLYVCLCGLWLGRLLHLSFLSTFLKLVFYMYIYMHIYFHVHVHDRSIVVHGVHIHGKSLNLHDVHGLACSSGVL